MPTPSTRPTIQADLPTITFGEGCDDDSVYSVLAGWSVTVCLHTGANIAGIVRWDAQRWEHVLTEEDGTFIVALASLNVDTIVVA